MLDQSQQVTHVSDLGDWQIEADNVRDYKLVRD